MRQYFAGKNGQQLGPFTEAEIRAKALSGELSATDLVWCEGMTNWEPLSSVFTLDDPSNPYHPSAAVMSGGLGFSSGGGHQILAGRWIRLVASILDGLLVIPALIPFFVGVGIAVSQGIPQQDIMNSGSALVGMLVSGLLGLGLLILNLIWLSTRGQTVGKRMTGIKIVRFQDGKAAGFVKTVLLRIGVIMLISIPLTMIHETLANLFSLVNILFIFRDDRRCLHDLIAGTKVVNVTNTAA